MVKVQKPNPKTLQKPVPGKPKNAPIKKSKEITTKEKGKELGKTIQKVGKKEIVQEVKPKAAPAKKVAQKEQKPKQNKNKVEKEVKPKNVPQKQNKKEIEKDVKPKNVPQKQQQKPVQNKKPVVEKTENKKGKESKVPQKKPVEKVEAKKQPVKKEVPQKQQPKQTEKKTPVEKAQNKKTKQNKKEEKEETTKKSSFEPTNFDEDKFNDIVNLDNIKKISKALKTLVEKQVTEKKTSIFSDYKYFLNIASYKIPNCPKRMVKLNLKHSLVDPKVDDIVLIVPDLQRGAKVDYEPTIQHYEDLLRENGVENVKIVPFNQLRNEYTTFEAKRKFANTYDYFMCDGRIVSHAVGFLGKHFQKPRSTLHAVRLDNAKTYKSDIERALKRTAYKQLHKGDLVSIPVGNDRFTTNQVAENVEQVIEQLKTLFPGGYANIRNIYLKLDIKGTSSVPLYVSLSGPPAETPTVVGPREQKMLKLKKQANDILSKFSMSKTGEFVKLDKAQVERKQKIREARAGLLEESDEVPAKKAKKEEEDDDEEDVEEEIEGNDVEEDGDVEDDEDEDDDNEEDDDEEQGGSEDDEEVSDEE